MGTIFVKRRIYSEALVRKSEKGVDELVTALIRAGADVNFKTSNGRSALMRAAIEGHDKCVGLLIKSGADVNLADSYQETALLCAAVNGHEKCVDLLIRAGADVNHGAALTRTAANGYDKCVALLLTAGADVNNDGATAMIEAIKTGSDSSVDLLIKAGVSVNSCDNWNDTPLLRSAKDSRYKCVNLLVNAGADVNTLDREGNNALMASVDNRNDIMHMWTPRSCVSRIRCVQLLLKAGASVNIRNRYGQNTFDLHVRRALAQDEDIAMLLFAAGESINGTGLKRRWWDSGAQVAHVKIPTYLQPPTTDKLCLYALCTETIRNYLMKIGSVNLFVRVPQLGLPASITECLLYHVSLETEYDDDDDVDDDNNDHHINAHDDVSIEYRL